MPVDIDIIEQPVETESATSDVLLYGFRTILVKPIRLGEINDIRSQQLA
jgi:hypothetical protein